MLSATAHSERKAPKLWVDDETLGSVRLPSDEHGGFEQPDGPARPVAVTDGHPSRRTTDDRIGCRRRTRCNVRNGRGLGLRRSTRQRVRRQPEGHDPDAGCSRRHDRPRRRGLGRHDRRSRRPGEHVDGGVGIVRHRHAGDRRHRRAGRDDRAVARGCRRHRAHTGEDRRRHRLTTGRVVEPSGRAGLQPAGRSRRHPRHAGRHPRGTPRAAHDTATSLTEFTDSAGELQQQLDDLATSVQTISDDLSDTGSIVDQYRASVAERERSPSRPTTTSAPAWS